MGAGLGLEEGVVQPALGLVDVLVGGDDIIVAGEDDGAIEGDEFLGARHQPLHPGQLVLEFGAGDRIAVGQIKAADQDAVHRRLDIARLAVVRIAGKAAMGFDRLAAAGEDGDSVPAALAVPDHAIARFLDLGRGKFFVGRFELLQAGDIGLRPRRAIRAAGQGGR